tara:strand:- start:10303 stop:10485 length:183 start_codon:yes stop_codon:yes gene_type:complete
MVVCLNKKTGENPRQAPASAFEANEADIMDGVADQAHSRANMFCKKKLPMVRPGRFEQRS